VEDAGQSGHRRDIEASALLLLLLLDHARLRNALPSSSPATVHCKNIRISTDIILYGEFSRF